MLLALLLSCSTTVPETAPTPQVPPEPAPVPEKPAEPAAPAEPGSPVVVLDGVTLDADWDDGDTFGAMVDGQKVKARMKGFNTLESYGPVHRWGDWKGAELYAIAKEAGVRARSEAWECTTSADEGGGYGRDLVDCPKLRQVLLQEGLAHVFAIDEEPDAADVADQHKAMEAKAGMWAKGVPEGLITSLHSAAENKGRPESETYNRVADPQTGKAHKSVHSDSYETCQEVCVEGSCMVYVPYEHRYGDDKADCLKI